MSRTKSVMYEIPWDWDGPLSGKTVEVRETLDRDGILLDMKFFVLEVEGMREATEEDKTDFISYRWENH